MIYSVQYGQTVYDVVLATYGSLELTYKLIQDNPFIDSVNYDFDANPGAKIVWDETYSITPPPELNKDATASQSDLKYIIATNGQSIYDICLMTYGDLGYLYKLMADNNIISPNDTDINEKKINFNPNLIQDIGFYNLLSSKKIKINTLSEATQIKDGFLQTDDGVDLITDDDIQIIVD